MNEHREKLQEIIQRDFAASLLNTTKWMEILDIVQMFAAWYRIKLVMADKPSQWSRGFQGGNSCSYLPRGYVEGWYSPIEVLEIEWLEIALDEPDASAKPVYKHTAQLAARLEERAVVFTVEQNVIQILGHLRY